MTTISLDLDYRLRAVDVSYWLDTAEENFTVAPDLSAWLRYFCPQERLIRMIEQVYEPIENDEDWVAVDEAETIRQFADTGDRLEAAFTNWLTSSTDPWEHKVACLCIGVSRIPGVLRELSNYISDSTIVEHNEYRFARRDAPKDGKRIKAIKAYKPRREQGHYAIDIYDWSPFKQHKHAINVSQMIRRMRDRADKYRQRFPSEIRLRYPAVMPYLAGDDSDNDYTETHQHRKVIRRGIDLLADLIGYPATRAFVSKKEPLVIPGRQVSFRLTLDSVAQDSSHGAMTTEVLVGDEPVCNLCIYTKDTPPLDHVASIIAHVRSGLEDDLLETGNPFNIKAKGPTGVEVLDKKFQPVLVRRQRIPHITVSAIRPPLVGPVEDILETEHDASNLRRTLDVIRLGESKLVRHLTRKRARRINGYFFQTEMSGFKFPNFRLVEVR